MHYNREKGKEASQAGGNQHFKTFPPPKPSVNRPSSFMGDGQPISKKPKLDQDDFKIVNSFASTSKPTTSKRNGDMYDDLWGDDPDSSILQQLEFDETQALTQVPVTEKMVTTNVLPNINPSQNLQHLTIPFHQGQTSASLANKGNSNRLEFANKTTMASSFMKNSSKVPLRRTASSGWPSTSSFTPSHSQNLSIATKMNAEKKYNEIVTIQSGVEQLRIENENLKEKLAKKTGEANLIRDRLINVQQEFNKQKKNYMDKIDAVTHEAERNNTQLQKQISSLKGQLDVKAMEMESAERRAQHLNSVNRLHPESPNNRFRSGVKSVFSPARANKQSPKEDQLSHRKVRTQAVLFELLQQIVTPELIRPSQPEVTIVESVRTITNPGLFSGPVGTRQVQNAGSGESSKSTVFFTGASSLIEVAPAVRRQLSVACPSMEPCSLSLLSSRLLDVNSDNAQHIFSEVIGTCRQILIGLRDQLNSAICPQNRYIEREREVLHCGNKYLVLTEDYNLLCSKELYNNERGICARRALVLLSLLVEINPDFAVSQILPSLPQLNEERNKNMKEVPSKSTSSETFISVIKDIVCQIEKQRRTLMFEGVLSGVMVLIKSLLKSDPILSQHSQEMTVQIIKAVVFARPGSLVVHNILQALFAAIRYPNITEKLCNNSVKKTFVENPRHSIITYTPDSCILQVLCTLIQIVETPKKYILSDVFTTWVLNLFYNSQRSPKWLFSVPSETSCQCRPLVTRLTFTLLGEACILYPEATETEKKSLQQLLTRGILLVYTLLYHDEHFGANVDPASVGYYELFLHSMNTFESEMKLNTAYHEILDNLCIQESLRQPSNTCEGKSNELNSVLSAIYRNPNNPQDPLDLLV